MIHETFMKEIYVNFQKDVNKRMILHEVLNCNANGLFPNSWYFSLESYANKKIICSELFENKNIVI